VKWAEILQQRLMGYKASSSIRQAVDGTLAKAGIELLWFDEVDTLSSLVSYLRTGQFVGVVPRLVASQLDELAVVPLAAPRIERKIYLLRRNDVEMNDPARSFWNDVRARLGSALDRR
jgi:DNA-binding transcriptional LysR family regulator